MLGRKVSAATREIKVEWGRDETVAGQKAPVVVRLLQGRPPLSISLTCSTRLSMRSELQPFLEERSLGRTK